MLRFYTAGESHGKCLIGFLEGLPSGLCIDANIINEQLRRRQLGYGRGGRMAIESDRIEILSGIRHGKTLGSPISFMIPNKDWIQWQIPMSIDAIAEDADARSVTKPRPGHADLPGALKHRTHDMRDILERASARETATRVAGGAFCRILLAHFGIRIGSHVLAIGSEKTSDACQTLSIEEILTLDYEAHIRCADSQAADRMITLIDETRKNGDTLGGIVEVVADKVPPGLGSHIQWDRRLDGLISQALMSIPSAKAVAIGQGVECASLTGSQVHDPIFYDSLRRSFFRKTNRAGGVEGGISNGAEIRARIYLKPIPTLSKPLASVDVKTKTPFAAAIERSDVCVIPAAGVVAEAMLGIVLASVFLEKFSADSLKEVEENYRMFVKYLEEY